MQNIVLVLVKTRTLLLAAKNMGGNSTQALVTAASRDSLSASQGTHTELAGAVTSQIYHNSTSLLRGSSIRRKMPHGGELSPELMHSLS